MTRAADIRRDRLIGIVVIAVGVLLVAIAFAGHVPLLGGEGGRDVSARFAQANEVDSSTPVRVGGVDVGHVVALRRAPGDTTTLVMRLTTSGIRLHADAGAQIRWRTLLGGSMYIDLDPGSPSAPALRGEIPLARTASQVDWDQFNAQLPAAARAELRRELGGFDAALRSPAGTGRTLHVLGPALATVGAGAEPLRGRDIGDLPSAVRNAGRTLSAIGGDPAQLQRLLAGADATLAVTAAHNAALGEALALSPPALAATRRASRTLGRTLTALDPLIARLAPGARLLGPADAVLAPLLRRADATLHRAEPLLAITPESLRQLGAAGAQGSALIAGLTPVISRLDRELLPFLARTDPDTRLKLYETFGPVASALSSTLSGFDVNGYSYDFNVQLSTGSLLLPCDLGFTGVPHLGACLTQKPSHR
jgi:virulence factor Mce-like protein